MSISKFSPLRYPEDWPGAPSAKELAWQRIPILGWGMAWYLKHRRIRKSQWEFARQLSEREPIPASLWGEDPRRLEVANLVVKQCVDAIGWKHPHFIPDDLFEILIEWRTGMLSELDAIFRMERAFKVKLTPEHAKRWYEEGTTFGELVDYLLENSPNYSQTN